MTSRGAFSSAATAHLWNGCEYHGTGGELSQPSELPSLADVLNIMRFITPCSTKQAGCILLLEAGVPQSISGYTMLRFLVMSKQLWLFNKEITCLQVTHVHSHDNLGRATLVYGNGGRIVLGLLL